MDGEGKAKLASLINTSLMDAWSTQRSRVTG
jgi:hypothetical protein